MQRDNASYGMAAFELQLKFYARVPLSACAAIIMKQGVIGVWILRRGLGC